MVWFSKLIYLIRLQCIKTASNNTKEKTFKSGYYTYAQPIYPKKARSGIVAGGILSGVTILNSIIFHKQLRYPHITRRALANACIYTGCGAIVDYLRNNKAPNKNYDKTDTGRRVGAWLGVGTGVLLGLGTGLLGLIASVGICALGGWCMGMISDHFAYKNNK